MSEYVVEEPSGDGSASWRVREKIVRCKDCEYMERQTTFDGSMSWFLCSHFKRPTRCDGFCAWGVRS